jgi:hypothetical protein
MNLAAGQAGHTVNKLRSINLHSSPTCSIEHKIIHVEKEKIVMLTRLRYI